MVSIVMCRLGRLASMAGIEESDFGHVKHPQFSSTQRDGHRDQASEQRKGNMAVSAIKVLCMAETFTGAYRIKGGCLLTCLCTEGIFGIVRSKFCTMNISLTSAYLLYLISACAQQTTSNLQKASRPQSITPSSVASVVSKSSQPFHSTQEISLTPAPLHSEPSPSPLDHPEAPQLQRSVSPSRSNSNRESGSDKHRGSRGSRSGSSASSASRSVHSKLSYSYREDFSEGKLSPALSSRSSSMSQIGSERLAVSEGQSGAVGLAGL